MSDQLKILFEDYFRDHLKLNPLHATIIGKHKYDNLLPDFYSDEYTTVLKQHLERYLNNSYNISVTSHRDTINLKAFQDMLKLQIEGLYLPFNELPINQMNNIFLEMMSLIVEPGLQPLRTQHNIDMFRERMSKFPQLIDTMIEMMNRGILSERVLPVQITEQVIKQIEGVLHDKPYRACKSQIGGNLYAQLKNIIREYFIPPAEKTLKFLKEIYLAHSRHTIGYSDIPTGDQMYRYLVKLNTTKYDLPIKTIYKMGLSESQRILEEMTQLQETLPIQDFSSDPQFYKKTPEEVLAAYRKMRSTINKTILPKYFGKLRPPVEYLIKAVPKFNETFSSTAYYMGPSIDNKRPGVFYVNLRNLHEHPTYNMEVLTLHEGNPGHHYQISLSQNNSEIPKFRSFDYGSLTAFVEGWGLYCETLGEYKDGYSKMGKYEYEIMRAARLVIDTGIHHLGWDFARAKEFLTDVTDLAESEIDAEIYRYIAIPGQALSYKIGELCIQSCRDKYLAATNSDLINFHEKLMEIGPLPLWLLEDALLEG